MPSKTPALPYFFPKKETSPKKKREKLLLPRSIPDWVRDAERRPEPGLPELTMVIFGPATATATTRIAASPGRRREESLGRTYGFVGDSNPGVSDLAMAAGVAPRLAAVRCIVRSPTSPNQRDRLQPPHPRRSGPCPTHGDCLVPGPPRRSG